MIPNIYAAYLRLLPGAIASAAAQQLNLAADTDMDTPDNKEVKASGKRKPPAAGKGRPKGATNKTTRSVKEAISLAAEQLGGTDRLVAWAKEDPTNERLFWSSIYLKLLPLQVSGEGGGAIQLVLNGSDIHG